MPRGRVVAACLASTLLGAALFGACSEKKTNLPFIVPTTPVPPVVRDKAAIAYSVKDRAGLASVQVDVSTDGGLNYRPATAAAGSPSQLVPATAFGTSTFFLWDSFADLGPGLHRDVRLRFAGSGKPGPGIQLTAGPMVADETDRVVALSPAGVARTRVVAAPFPDGSVWIAGGRTSAAGAQVTAAEVFDPAKGTLSPAEGMHTARDEPALALLAGGRILLAGGQDVSGMAMRTAETVRRGPDGTVATLDVPGGLVRARANAAVAPLAGGGAVVVGGVGPGGELVSEVEAFDPNAQNGLGAFAVVASSSLAARTGATATLLGNGRVLIAGGADGAGNAIATAALFDPATATVTATGSLVTARVGHRAVLLNDGRVLLAGGSTESAGLNPVASVEVFDPVSGQFAAVGAMKRARTRFGLCLAGGRVLAYGGTGPAPDTATSGELLDLETLAWSDVAFPDASARSDAVAVTTGPGRALIAGGLAPPAVYWPRVSVTTESWYDVRSPSAARVGHVAARVASAFGSQVLLIGGTSGVASATAVVESFRESNDEIAPRSPLGTPRAFAAGAALFDGRIVVAGGVDASGTVLGTAELYDPVADRWTATGSLTTPRADATATAVLGGVLFAGGRDANGKPLASVELYDPIRGGFTATGGLSTPRADHAAIAIPSGGVLIAGGRDASGAPVASVEVYDGLGRRFLAPIPLRSGRAGPLLGSGFGSSDIVVLGGVDGSGLARRDGEAVDTFGRVDRPNGIEGLFPRAFGGSAPLLSGAILLSSLGTSSTLGSGSTTAPTGSTPLLGDILFAGGTDGSGGVADRSVILVSLAGSADATAGTVRKTLDARMRIGRVRPTVVPLGDGRVLVAGGTDVRGVVVAGCEVFAP